MSLRLSCAVALLGLSWAATGCSPNLDWRELRPDTSGLVVLFPCRPTTESRTVALGGADLPMTVWVCQAGGSHYALSRLDAGDPARAVRAEAALHQAAAHTLGVGAAPPVVEALAGLRDAPARRLQLTGRTPDGLAVEQQLVTFLAGPIVYQATVFGTRLPAAGVDGFFSGIALSRRP